MRGHLYGGDRFGVRFSSGGWELGRRRQGGWARGRGQLRAEAPWDKGLGLGARRERVGLGALQRLVGQLGLARQGLGLGVGPRGGLRREELSRPGGAPASFRLRGGGRGAGHKGELMGRGRQDELSNRLQGRQEPQVEQGAPRAQRAPRPPHAPPPRKYTQRQEDPKAGGGSRRAGGAFATRGNDTRENKTENVQLARAAGAPEQHAGRGSARPPPTRARPGGQLTHPGAAERAGGQA